MENDNFAAFMGNDGFTRMNNPCLRDTRLNLASMGLMFQLMSVKDNPNWEHSIGGYASAHHASRAKVQSLANLLAECGYIVREQKRKSGGGRFGSMMYHICDQPVFKDTPMTTSDFDRKKGRRRSRKGNFVKLGLDGWTNIVNNPCKDRALSYRGLGLIALLMSLPSDIRISYSTIEELCQDGSTSVRRAVTELEDLGYLRRMRIRENDGTLAQAIWVLTCYPNVKEALERVIGKDCNALQPALFPLGKKDHKTQGEPVGRASEGAQVQKEASKFSAVYHKAAGSTLDDGRFSCSEPMCENPSAVKPAAAERHNKNLFENKRLNSNQPLPSHSLTCLEEALARASASAQREGVVPRRRGEDVIPPMPARTRADNERDVIQERKSFNELLSIALNKNGLKGEEGRTVEKLWNEVLNTGVNARTVVGAYALYAEDRVKRGQRKYIRRLSKWLSLDAPDGVHYWTAVYEDEVYATRHGVKRATRKYRAGAPLTRARHANVMTLIEDPQRFIQSAIEYRRAKEAGLPYKPSKPLRQFELRNYTSDTQTAPETLSESSQTRDFAPGRPLPEALAAAKIFEEAPEREREGVPSFVPWATADGGVDVGLIANYLREHAKPSGAARCDAKAKAGGEPDPSAAMGQAATAVLSALQPARTATEEHAAEPSAPIEPVAVVGDDEKNPAPTRRHSRTALELVAGDLGIDPQKDPEEFAALAAEMRVDLDA